LEAFGAFYTPFWAAYGTVYNKFAKISDFLKSFLAGYQRKQEMKPNGNEYLLNHRMCYKCNYDTNLYIV
jgi:hypothetical protein